MKKLFDQLLTVKKQRERSARARLEEILREEEAVRQAAIQARNDIAVVLEQWNALLRCSGTQTRQEFDRWRAQLTDLSARERAL
jgi:hypothetical protein